MKVKRLYGLKVWISDRTPECNKFWADVHISYPNKRIDKKEFWLGGSASLVFNLFEDRVERDNAEKRLQTQIRKGWLDNSSYKFQNNIRKVTYIVKRREDGK